MARSAQNANKQISFAHSADEIGGRDQIALLVSVARRCRRAELVQLQIDDLTIKADDSGTILVRKSKTGQFAHGRLAYL